LLTKQYWKVSTQYHPDKVEQNKKQEYQQKFQDLSLAVNTLKKYIAAKDAHRR
jgi:DnaJ-class molecular chaperone